jgi:hypothetical protein
MSDPKDARALLLLLTLASPAAWSQILPGQILPGQMQPGQVAPPGVTSTAPVGSGPAGTTTQIFPNAPNPTGGVSLSSGTSTVPSGINSTAIGAAGLSGLSSPSGGLSSSLGPTGLLPGSGSPTSATSTNVPGYATPATNPLPGYTAPPGSLGFPPVSSVPTPGSALTPITPVAPAGSFTGSSGSVGTTGSGVGMSNNGILTRPAP